MKKPIVYAIVVTYNRLNFLKKCVSSILKQTYPLKKIIIVDNCSIDGTRNYLKKLIKKYPNIQAIFNKANLGMANAINLALMTIEAEDWDYVWITDDDNIADKNALLNLVKNIDKKTGMYNSLLIDYKQKNKLTFSIFDFETNKIFKFVNDLKNKNFVKSLIPFNFTMANKDIFKKIGFLSEDYFIRGEEIDYFIRSLINKIEVKIIPCSKAYCLKEIKRINFKLMSINIEREILTEKKLYYVIRNSLIILKKYQNIIKKIPEKEKFYNFFPFFKYDLIYFLPFYFIYNIFLGIFKVTNLKMAILAYWHFLINKKGKTL